MRFLNYLVFCFCLSTSFLQASEIPGYVGNQTFRLSDDRGLFDFNNRIEDAKVEYARADRASDQLEDQLRDLDRQISRLKDQMESLVREADSLKAQKNNLVTELARLKIDPVTNAAAIAEKEREITQIETATVDKMRQAGALKLEIGSVATRADRVRRDLEHAQRRARDIGQAYQQLISQRDNYLRDLISAIQNINNEGARQGLQDGSSDGAILSRRMGDERGNFEGQNDGERQGTFDGQARDYKRGSIEGDRVGSQRAIVDGVRIGTSEGIRSGNKSAGTREGRVAGIIRASDSNAAEVGMAQGKKAGFERAIKTGQVDGKNIGESETTKKIESGNLESLDLKGPFAGTFSRTSPGYPGDFNGERYRPTISHSNDLLRSAYADGYEYRYREYTRYEFLRRIDTDFNDAYDRRYQWAYEGALRLNYPAHYERGFKDGDERGYARDYPIARAKAYREAFESTDENPNRDSNEFKNSYKEAEVLAYAEKYEEIRRANFDRLEAEVFAAHIAEQTEIYRQKRIAEVTAIYNNNAVLEFVNSSMLDAGIKGVAALDGVFQPGERTVHTVVIKNFGFKEASQVSVQISGGATVKVATIPARSMVTIAGVAEGVVTTALNSTFKSSLKVLSVLTSSDAVEGRHFDQSSGGILKEADQKSVKVLYPLSLSGLALDGQLLKNVKNKLKITLTNNSKREYKGAIKVKLLANSQNGIIAKEFSDVDSLKTSLNLSDADVLVSEEADIYRELSFSATVEQDGVLLGVLSDNLETMAKAQFSEVAGRPVLIADSSKSLKQLLDALNEIGGTSKVSVLDLSLSSLNAQILANGLSSKTLLVLDDEAGVSVKSLNSFIGKSKSSSFVFIDEAGTGLKNALGQPALKDAPKILFGKRTMVFTNPHRAAGVLKMSTLFQSTLKNFTGDLELANMFALSAPEMIALLKERVTPANFGTPNNTIKVFSLKALAEVLCINEAYDESGGIFNRDKKWPKMIEEDTSMFMHQLKSAAGQGVMTSKLPHILSAIAMKDTLENAMFARDGMKLKIRSVTNGVLEKMEDTYKKNLKKDFKELYNKAYEVVSVHRPFAI